MRSPRRTRFIATFLATTIASRPCFVASFQAPAVPSPFSSAPAPAARSRNRRHGSWSRAKTAATDSAEVARDDGHPQDDDAATATGDSWALRQITFLGLSAPDESAAASGDDAAAPKAGLDARNLSEFLMEIGACSVSLTDSDADTDRERPLFDEPSLEAGEEGANTQWAMIIPDLAAGRNLWRQCDVAAHFPASFDVASVVDSVRYTFACPSGPRFRVDDVPDRDWVLHVQESWDPIVTRASKFVLRFPWHDDQRVMKACQEAETEKLQAAMERQFRSGVKREGAVVHFEGEDAEYGAGARGDGGEARDYVQIELEGGIAFGTGEHPTTRLCLDWVRDKVERRAAAADGDAGAVRFLDYGAGSGVLGIAAAAVARDCAACPIAVVGVEIDADAIHIAHDNAGNNGVDMQNYLPDLASLGDGEALSVVLRSLQRKRNRELTTLPDALNGPVYDLCAANILAAPLVSLAPTIGALMKSPGGEIGLSGILAAQADSVVAAYGEFFDDVHVAGEDDGWVLITGKRR